MFLLAGLALLSWLLALWQWAAGWRFPFQRRVPAAGAFTPAVTLLKPLKGCDARTGDCLRSWLRQDYPGPVQMLFGVASPADPAVEAVQQLLREHPGADARLVVCPETRGFNAKVSTLIQLSRQAAHGVIVVSDADVRVPPDFLLNAIAPLRDPGVGLVNPFYRLAQPVTAAMRCEAVAINADFWSQVLQGRSLQPLDFALGAVMVTRRAQLAEIGGFEALADYLADDFQLGNRIARAGGRIELCPVVVECLSPAMGWREVWSHQLRWARTIRVSKPLPYAASILGNATLWPLLWCAAQPGPLGLVIFSGCLLSRMLMAHFLQQRLHPGSAGLRWCWLAPVKDLMQFALWLSAFLGNHIRWRGQRFRLRRDGRLVPA